MKKLINYVFVLSFFVSFSQKKISIPQALNIASKQSMLCERLAKEKVFHVTNPNNFNTEHKLGVSLIQFERNISRLKEMELPEETLFLVKTTEMLWFTYKKSLLDKDHISTIKTMEYNKIILSFCEQLFNNLLNYAENKKYYPYNTKIEKFPEAYIAVNKLKSLSQKLSLYHNVYFSKVNDYNSAYYNAIFSDIDASIANINTLKNSNSLIKEKTTKIENEWNTLKREIKDINFNDKENSKKPEDILKQNNELLKDADLLNRYYKELSETN